MAGPAAGPRRRKDAKLGQEIPEAFQASRRTYSRVRLTRELKNRGHASAAYRAALGIHGLVASMSRPANPCDNADMESLYSTLKTETVPMSGFSTRARAALFDFIEVFYNRRRLHSALGFQSPVDFEAKLNQPTNSHPLLPQPAPPFRDRLWPSAVYAAEVNPVERL